MISEKWEKIFKKYGKTLVISFSAEERKAHKIDVDDIIDLGYTKKIVKKYGKTLVISFNSENQKVYKIKEGKKIDLSNIKIIRSKKIKNDKIKI